MGTPLTLTQHIMKRQEQSPAARGKLSALLTQIGVAGKLIQDQVRRAGLVEIWGGTGDVNVQGEKVQKLDRIANEIFINAMKQSGCVAAMASEEDKDIIEVPEELSADYIVLFDPLDGSTNIDANVTIGTIFAIYKRTKADEIVRADILRPGREQVAAGYILYGSSTVLVYTAGETVDCFTLDPGAGEYFLTRESVRMPKTSKVFSINEFNAPYWPAWVQPFVSEILSRNDADKRRISARHIGSLVADFHRNLIYGGIFLYPPDSRSDPAKLRILYECNPLAFIAEVAGGAASTGTERVLDVVPKSLHDRVGFIAGPTPDVELAERFARERG